MKLNSKKECSHRRKTWPSTHLINEAASRLSTAVKTGDMQTAKVAQIMLDSGNDKLNEAMKQLVNVRACKEKLQAKLMKAQGTLR